MEMPRGGGRVSRRVVPLGLGMGDAKVVEGLFDGGQLHAEQELRVGLLGFLHVFCRLGKAGDKLMVGEVQVVGNAHLAVASLFRLGEDFLQRQNRVIGILAVNVQIGMDHDFSPCLISLDGDMP